MNKNFLLLHLSFFLMSVPAQFAKGIQMPAGILIWWRCLFGTIIAFTLLFIIKKARVNKTDFKWLIISGLVMGLHWWTYFLSIQLSSVGVGILALFTYPIISVFLEPFFFKTKTAIKQVIGGLGIIGGIYFLIPEFSLTNNVTLGVVIGVASAFFFSLRNILTRKYLSEVPALTTMGYHILSAFVLLSIPLIANTDTFLVPSKSEAGLILLLASFFTIGSHALVVYSLKHYSVSTIGILGGLQVLYGSLLAFIIFTEIPNVNFYMGAVIILGVSIFETLPLKKKV